MTQHKRTHSFKKRYVQASSVALIVILAFAYQAHRVRQRRIADGLAEVNAISFAQPMWRCPGPVNAFCALTGSTPPDRFKRYIVQLSPAQVTDAMVDHLIAIDSLDSLIIKTPRATGRAVASPVPLQQLPIVASCSSITRLTEKYPDLFLYVDPVGEFATDDSG